MKTRELFKLEMSVKYPKLLPHQIEILFVYTQVLGYKFTHSFSFIKEYSENSNIYIETRIGRNYKKITIY